MSQLPDEKLLQHLADGVSQLTPDRAEQLWEQPVTAADGTEWYLERPSAKKASRKKYYMSAIAACLVLCIFCSFFFQLMPSAAVYLDVNPSISLDVNYRNRVTGAHAHNEDAEQVLDGMDLTGTDLDVALYAILGSMVHNGYLTESQDTILVSVSCSNESRAAELQRNVSGLVSSNLKDLINAGEVLSHQVATKNEHGGSKETAPGKAAFITDLEEKYPQLEEDDLEELTIDEIVSILKEEALDYSDYTDHDDDNDDDNDDQDDPDDDDSEDDEDEEPDDSFDDEDEEDD